MSKIEALNSKSGHHCSFCGMHLTERKWSYPGPCGARICGECVAVCVEIMAKGHRHWHSPIEGEIAKEPAREVIAHEPDEVSQ